MLRGFFKKIVVKLTLLKSCLVNLMGVLLRRVNLKKFGVIKVFLQVVVLVFLTVILVTQKFNLLPYAFGLVTIFFILLGFEEIKLKKNSANGLTLLSAVVIMIIFLGFSYL
jgi:hypothetical protein